MSARKLLAVLGLLTISTSIFAQNPPPYTFTNNLVQPAPNAAGLGKYADYPVSYYTGVPEVSVPLYTLKDGGVTVPISLSYHASGIRVSEVATWVGLGWVLNAGGIITRTVMGAPDEGTQKLASGIANMSGYYRSNGISSLPKLPDPSNWATQGSSWNFYYAPDIANCRVDGEPDIYTFNFNGHVGKFIFDENRTAHTLEDDNLKITPNYYNGAFLSFTIITPDGIKYVFGENNTYQIAYPVASCCTIDADSKAPASWYLTSIINPNTKDTVTFNYTPESYGYMDLGPETTLSMIPTTTPTTVNTCDNSNIQPNIVTTSINDWRLTSITSKNYNIQFVANNTRTDVDGAFSSGFSNPAPKRLDQVKVYNNINQCISQWALSYSYFQSNTNTASGVTALTSSTTDTKRLKLLSVTESSGDGSIQKPPYLLAYNETLQLPRRLSYDQDEWGYSNNYLGNANSYFTPKVSNGYCYVSPSPTGANRAAKFPDMSAFTLTSIQNPLGATTTFTFEGNTSYLYDNVTINCVVGGLRINKISVVDNVTGKTQTKSYSYNNSNGYTTGSIFNTPVHLINIDNEFFWKGSGGGNAGYIGYASASRNQLALYKTSQSVVPLQNLQGILVGYTQVKETFGGTGQGGYIVRSYSNGAGQSTLVSRIGVATSDGATSYMAYGVMNGVGGLYGSGQFNEIAPQNLEYSSSFLTLYPFTPLQVDFTRGQLLSVYTYDSSGNPISSTDNTYSTTFHENLQARGVKGYVLSTGSGSTAITWYALSFYKLHTGISHLVSTTNKTYSSSSNYLSQVTTFGYESPNHTLQTSDTTTDSQGNTLINKTYYSLDYANTATSDNVFGKMKARNILAPVRSDSWRNGNLVGERVTRFYDFAAGAPDTLINPVNIYSLEASVPLTPTQASESTVWSSPLSTLVPNSYLISKVNLTYDNHTGKLINQQLTNDKSQAVLWSGKLNVPLAIVNNAQNTNSLKEFYYEGFEESTASNLWTGVGHTGTESVFAPYTVSWTLPNSRSYVISYWYYANSKWNFQPEQAFTGSLALSGGTAYDDIRIYPSDASMINYTYDATGNLTSSIDAKGLTSYYEYDSFQRLKNVRDKDKNIVKSFCYNYAGQANGCYITQPSYTNNPASGTYVKNCSSGYTGTQVTYNVAAGTYISNISPQDADNQAAADVQANGQTYANINGGCTVNASFVLTNTTNSGYQINFSSGSYSYTYDFLNSGTTTIQVPVGTYSVNIYPTGAYVNHTISLTGQTTQTNTPRYTFNGVVVSTSTQLTASVQ